MKRIFDIIVSAFALILLLPLMLVVAATILLMIGRPVRFRQLRPGLQAQPFEMLKFRTMTNDTDPDGSFLADGARITALGHFLRRTSLDELPEFWNVLKGNMSLVGPRPLLMEYVPLYSAQQWRRHEVRPGLTGWAQVNGRNAVEWEERLRLDVWYVDNRNLWLDIKILLKTVLLVFTGGGVTTNDGDTMPKFSGAPSSSERER